MEFSNAVKLNWDDNKYIYKTMFYIYRNLKMSWYNHANVTFEQKPFVEFSNAVKFNWDDNIHIYIYIYIYI